MKRWTMRTAIIVVALILALTGMALAVAGDGGVLRFLFPDKVPVEVPVQTLPMQSGGDQMQTIAVTVRDAVSDGVAIHMAVEFAAKDPKDALLYDLDANYIYIPTGSGWPKATLPLEEEGQGFRKPYVSKAKEADRVLIVGTPMAMLGGIDMVAGTNWFYESPSVLVVDYVLDLRPTFFQGYENPPTGPLPDPLTVTLTPSVWLQTQGSTDCIDLEKGQIAATVTQTKAAQKRYEALNLPIEGAGYRLDSVSFVLTPLGTYGSFVLSDTSDDPGWGDSPMVGSFGLRVLDPNGLPIPFLNGGYKKNLDEEAVGKERMETFLPAQESLPATLILRPFDAGTGQTFPDITLSLRQL